MIEPILSLAYSLYSNKGVYALLLGSGVSRAASIPTGWEVVLDLIEKLSAMQKEDCASDPAKWYSEKYGEEPNYSKLIDDVAKSAEERQRLLATYFEPTELEREEGLKLPTKAHRAIAKLVASGHIRVILTTNFDRLIERAIEDEGITPVVLSTPDAIEGAIPLVHQQCCVIKLHGDYLDTRIKNSTTELASYDPRVDELLSRVLDEFGLLVCGWSAQWDTGLRAVIERCKSRRFTTYWATRGEPGADASRLIEQRKGTILNITGADSLFEELAEKVQSLDELEQPHPLSVAAASASVKRLLADDKHIIRLHDLLHAEAERAYVLLQSSFARLLQRGDQKERFATGVSEFNETVKIIRTVATQVAYWGQAKHERMLAQVITRLAEDPLEGQGGTHVSESLRVIPSIMVLYTLGIGAIANDNFSALAAVLGKSTSFRLGERKNYLTAIDWPRVQDWFKLLEGHDNKYYPASEWLLGNCRPILKQLIPNDKEYERYFDLFEVIRSLVYIDLEINGEEIESGSERWGPPGRFAWKYASRRENEDILGNIKADRAIADGLTSVGLFGGCADRFISIVDSFATMVEKFAVGKT